MKAIEYLKRLDAIAKEKKYANVPRNYIPATNFTDKTANGLTNCILKWMELHGHYATRINTMGRKLPDTSIVDVLGRTRVMPGTWIPGTTRRGTADIHAIIGGKHISIEVKVGRDRMSEEQHGTMHDIETSGGIYFIAKDFDSFYDWYQKITGFES